MPKTIILLIITFLFISCSKENITEVNITDDNKDGVYNLAPSIGVAGNTDIYFVANTAQGSAIWIINGPGSNIGMDIRDKEDSSFIYFADSYLGKSDNTAQTGTQIPLNRAVKLRLVIYKSGLSGMVVVLLESLGLDFFDSLEEYMIEKVYETEVTLKGE